MVKSFIVFIPVTAIVLHLALERRAGPERSGRGIFWQAAILALVIAAPWHIYIYPSGIPSHSSNSTSASPSSLVPRRCSTSIAATPRTTC